MSDRKLQQSSAVRLSEARNLLSASEGNEGVSVGMSGSQANGNEPATSIDGTDERAGRIRCSAKIALMYGPLTCSEIAQVLGADPKETQDVLHALDDEGAVLMRNGFYRLSEAAK